MVVYVVDNDFLVLQNFNKLANHSLLLIKKKLHSHLEIFLLFKYIFINFVTFHLIRLHNGPSLTLSVINEINCYNRPKRPRIENCFCLEELPGISNDSHEIRFHLEVRLELPLLIDAFAPVITIFGELVLEGFNKNHLHLV